MRVCLVTPSPPGSRHGNRTTALRWARLLRDLGHSVVVEQTYEDQACDLLVALHARRSADSVQRFRQRHPGAPLVVCLTGTDVYGGLAQDSAALRSVELATACVVLQPLAVEEIPPHLRVKAWVIHQSATAPPSSRATARSRGFTAVVLAHLREVKDPTIVTRAVRLLPPRCRLSVVHLGAALAPGMEEWAPAETEPSPR